MVRVATAVVGIPLVLAVDHFGGWVFGVAVGLIAALASHEFDAMMRAGGRPAIPAFGVTGAVAIAVAALAQSPPFALWITLLVIEIGLAAVYVLGPWAYRAALASWESTVAGILYVGLPLGFLSLLRVSTGGAWWVVVALVITWTYDTGAYLVGSTVGKHPFMQHVSPRKTVEGVAGGLVASTVAALIAVPAVGIPVADALALGLAGGVAAQAGDLVESMFKRQSGVKDSGTLIPGHGGVLDRIDGLMFVAVLVYYAAAALSHA